MKSSIPTSCDCEACQEFRSQTWNDAYYYVRYSIGFAFKTRVSGDPKSNAKKMGFRILKDVTIHRTGLIRREVYIEGTP